MKIKREELREALEIVKPGLANKEIVEQGTSFAFLGDRVVTFNSEISVSHPIQGLNLTGAIKAEALYQFLNRTKAEEIEITVRDNEVEVRAGKARAGLVFETEIRLPIHEIGEAKKWHNIPDGLIDALRFCQPVASKDSSRPVLQCIHVHKSGRVEGADVHQIVRVKLGNKLPIETFLIPATSVKHLLRYDVKKFALGEGWVHFRTEAGTVFSARVFQGEFPDVDPILTIEKGRTVKFPASVLDALERAEVFAESSLSKDSEVMLRIDENGTITIRAENEQGWAEETLEAEEVENGKTITIRTSPEVLASSLRQTLTCVIGENKLRFEGETWEAVIAASVDE